jgi:hypothetical protein
LELPAAARSSAVKSLIAVNGMRSNEADSEELIN